MRLKSIAWLAIVATAQMSGCAREDYSPPQSPPAKKTDAKAQAPATEKVIDPKADALLRKMSNYLAGLQSFTVTADHVTEVVRDSGEKLQFLAGSRVSVRRPNKLRSERVGEVVDATFVYDGSMMTMYGARQNLYAQAPAPPTLDDAIDCARDRLGIEAPAADLMFSSPYDVLMEGVVSGILVGPAVVDGVPTQHIAYQSKNVDWQLWIQDGDTPFPRRFVVTTKDLPDEPEFAVNLRDWNASPTLPDSAFTFVPPQNAQRTKFLTRGEQCRGLPPE
jgi:hypothetical protein